MRGVVPERDDRRFVLSQGIVTTCSRKRRMWNILHEAPSLQIALSDLFVHCTWIIRRSSSTVLFGATIKLSSRFGSRLEAA